MEAVVFGVVFFFFLFVFVHSALRNMWKTIDHGECFCKCGLVWSFGEGRPWIYTYTDICIYNVYTMTCSGRLFTLYNMKRVLMYICQISMWVTVSLH